MIVYVICHSCKKGFNPQKRETCDCARRQFLHNAQVGAREASAVAVNDATGEVVYCFDSPDRDMPAHYAKEGFRKVQFHSARELEKFCRSRNLVNDMEYGNAHDGAFEEYQKKSAHAEAEKRDRFNQYKRDRAKVEKEMNRGKR